MNIIYHKGQKYRELREKCLKSGKLFKDKEFSLYQMEGVPKNGNWFRPRDKCENPKFIENGISKFDAVQGKCRNCWLVSAVAVLVHHKHLFSKVVCKDNSFDENYAGIFHFRFWQFGQWVDVVVDDRLYYIGDNLVHMHSSDKNEFWSALLEKAYAKLNQSYEALNSGHAKEAFQDITGGICEMHMLNTVEPLKFIETLEKALSRRFLISCSTKPGPKITPEGLVSSHAYSLSQILKFSMNNEKICLLLIRNPWGKVEWNGSWSDKSPEFKSLSQEKSITLQSREDGEFLISFNDFLKHFEIAEICDPLKSCSNQLNPWKIKSFEGKWIKGECKKCPVIFHTNPLVDLTSLAEVGRKAVYSVTVTILQKGKRNLEPNKKREIPQNQNFFHGIGFKIYSVPKECKIHEIFDKDCKKAKLIFVTPKFLQARGITYRCRVDSDCYVVIPYIAHPYQECEFFMRVCFEQLCE